MTDRFDSRFGVWALHAYADGELDAHERANVETYLAEEPEARRMLDAIVAQKAALHRAYDDVVEEDVPSNLMARVSSSDAPKGNEYRLGPYAAAAACITFLAVGAAGGWYFTRDALISDRFDIAMRGLVAHEVYSVEVKHPVEVTAAESEHLQKWLSKRTGVAIKIPSIEKHGFQLLGGRLLAAQDRPAGQLMFEDLNKRRITVLIASKHDGHETGMLVEQKDRMTSCYWENQVMAMAVTAEMPRDELMKIAQDIYEQLEG